jgi:hypothetical protein
MVCGVVPMITSISIIYTSVSVMFRGSLSVSAGGVQATQQFLEKLN